jgi:hypothetical protein
VVLLRRMKGDGEVSQSSLVQPIFERRKDMLQLKFRVVGYKAVDEADFTLPYSMLPSHALSWFPVCSRQKIERAASSVVVEEEDGWKSVDTFAEKKTIARAIQLHSAAATRAK